METLPKFVTKAWWESKTCVDCRIQSIMELGTLTPKWMWEEVLTYIKAKKEFDAQDITERQMEAHTNTFKKLVVHVSFEDLFTKEPY